MSQNEPFSHFRNERGSAILLILLVAGITMFIAMSSLQSQADDSYKRLKIGRTGKIDANTLRSTVNMVLNSYAGCTANFANQFIFADHGFSPTHLIYGGLSTSFNNTIISLENFDEKRWGRKIAIDMRMDPDAKKFGPSGAGNHLALLTIFFQDGDTLKFPVWLTTNSIGQVTACHSTAFAGIGADGLPETLEERFCRSGSIPNQTTNWQPTDCLACTTSSYSVYSCVTCKQKGMVYDPTTKTCI